MLDKAEYSAFQSTLNSAIVSYRIVITKGTELGILHAAEVIDEFQKDEEDDEQWKDEKVRLRKC